jgi:hypothetical protein
MSIKHGDQVVLKRRPGEAGRIVEVHTCHDCMSGARHVPGLTLYVVRWPTGRLSAHVKQRLLKLEEL